MKAKNLFGLLVLGVVAVACGQQGQPELEVVNSMVIRAEGELLTPPDQANVSVNISCLNKDIQKSRDCLIEKAEGLSKKFTELGIQPEHIQTTAINQYRDYTWARNSQVFTGYRSNMSLVLTVKKLSVLETLYPLLLTDEQVNVGELQYSLSKPDSLSAAAYAKALRAANNIADRMLSEMGKSSKSIIRLGNVSLPSQPNLRYPGRDAAMNATVEQAAPVSAPQLTLNNGQIRIRETIYVEYGFE